MRIKRTNTILYCDRWDPTVRFYRDLIQLPVLVEKEWFVEFELHDHACLSVADAARTSISGSAGAGLTLSWRITDIEAVHQAMIAAGVEAAPLKLNWGRQAFFMFDPEGNRIELWS